jgi:predicted HTH transcriptional regulator
LSELQLSFDRNLSKRYFKRNHPFLFNIRHTELILKLAKTKDFITRKDVMELLHISGPQSYRLLKKLVQQGNLVGLGNTSAAQYKLK